MQRIFKGFTLAELLMALAILGVIATFSIPKILSAQANASKLAKAKEVAGMIAGAYQQAQMAGVVTNSTLPFDLTPYMNYVSVDTSGRVIDSHVLSPSRTCNTTYPCIRLHNGGILWFDNTAFTTSSTLRAIDFTFDPDPINNTTSTADGPLKAVQFTLYRDGFLTTRGVLRPGSIYPPAWDACPCDPSWFSW
jgi:prepilin-type N-terminal cleavage/methylation domain-containing protein